MKKLFDILLVALLLTPLVPALSVSEPDALRLPWTAAVVSLLLLTLLLRSMIKREFKRRTDPIFWLLVVAFAFSLTSYGKAVNGHEVAGPLILAALCAALYWVLIQGYVGHTTVRSRMVPMLAVVGSWQALFVLFGGETGANWLAGVDGLLAILLPISFAGLLASERRLGGYFYAAAVLLEECALLMSGSPSVLCASAIAMAIMLSMGIARRRPAQEGEGRLMRPPQIAVTLVILLVPLFFIAP